MEIMKQGIFDDLCSKPLEASNLVIVTCYTDFKDLAHRPKGMEAEHSMYIYELNTSDGTLTLLSVNKGATNLAFCRLHPKQNVVYACSESLSRNGVVQGYRICPKTGVAKCFTEQDACGTSTCYLTLDEDQKNMLLVNYWNSTVCTMPVKGNGALLPVRHVFETNEKGTMSVSSDNHVCHNQNDEESQRERQSDPHTHAIVLDPTFGCVAYVPDLGSDVIHEMYFDRASGELRKIGEIPTGPPNKSCGPRYLAFHPKAPVAYLINEIASEVLVFKYDRNVAEEIYQSKGVEIPAKRSLEPFQLISTIPDAFPAHLNTSGRIAVHPTGDFVVVSNRGHNSLAVFRTHVDQGGLLSLVGLFHTRGQTPRHFQFDRSGQWLIVANQDTDNLVIFQFNVSSGKITFTNNIYSLPSPNFVCTASMTSKSGTLGF